MAGSTLKPEEVVAEYLRNKKPRCRGGSYVDRVHFNHNDKKLCSTYTHLNLNTKVKEEVTCKVCKNKMNKI